MHPEILQDMQRANRLFGRRFLTIFGSAVIVMIVALSAPFLVFGVHASGLYIVLVFWSMLASIPIGFRYGQKRAKAEFDALGNLPVPCRICDVKVPWKDMPAHDAADHPRERRYFWIGGYIVVGSFFGVVVGVLIYISALYMDLVPPVDADVLQAWAMGALVAWAGSVALWGTFVDPRLKAKARAEWHATHYARHPAKR
jgi:hypothetical protein